MGYRTDMSVKNEAPSGGIAPCWGIAGMAEKVSRDRGYRSDTIAISRDMGQRVSNAALANAALVLSSKNWKKYSRWGAASKNKSKKPWALCRRAGIDAALVRVQFVLRGCTHHRK